MNRVQKSCWVPFLLATGFAPCALVTFASAEARPGEARRPSLQRHVAGEAQSDVQREQADACQGNVPPPGGLEPADIAQALKEQGLVGWVHGRSGEGGHLVFTVRSPDDFFRSVEMTLIGTDPASVLALESAGRHDQLCVTGQIAAFGGDQLHVLANAVVIKQPFDDGQDASGLPPYEHTSPPVSELPEAGEITARVHAVDPSRLVVEWGDRIVPVVVNPADLPGGLYRGDRVLLRYVRRDVPGRPPHLELDTRFAEPCEVVDRVAERHGQGIELVGVLALFPKSPQITRNIFALQVEEQSFLTNYTLVNFDNPELFQAIQEALQNLWTAAPNGRQRGRNNYVNPTIRLRVRGTLHIPSPAQANPQVLIGTLTDIQVFEAGRDGLPRFE